MSEVGGKWRRAWRSLRDRVDALPDLVRSADESIRIPDLRPLDVRRIVTTGIGSSAAHARLLAHLLAEHAGLPARFRTTSAIAAGESGGSDPDDALVVFSQGLSPNARLALDDPGGWRRVVLVTAVAAGRPGSDEKAAYVARLEESGVAIVRFPGEGEYETLVRIVGPVTGMLAAFRLARAIADALGRSLDFVEPSVDRIADSMTRAAGVVRGLFDGAAPPAGIAFLASGGYGELVSNLQAKVLEGMLRPLPPVFDLVELAHGPFQEFFPKEATLLALGRGTSFETALWPRVEAMIDPVRHRLLRLDAELPGPLALFEHEAMLDEILLRDVEARAVDQGDWPGRGLDRPLYSITRVPRRRLAELAWPELERLLAEGRRTAILPLGAFEQHGPHLPFATDAWVAEALADRFCVRVEEAIACPVVAPGCSSEHSGFPGTLSLSAATLEQVLSDLLESLRRSGFDRVFVFSAHGGNFAPLREALAALVARAAPMEVTAQVDLERVAALWHAESARHGVAAEASGHHAGEFETSIVRSLRPDQVRTRALAPGLVAPLGDPQSIFTPELRTYAPSGTVGDPRRSDATRGSRYLDAWTALLVDAYRGAKNANQANGIQNA